MAKSRQSFFIILMTMQFFLGCKKGVPDISTLRDLGGFSLDQTTIEINNKINPSFPISGRCNSNFNEVEISMDGGSQWIPLSSVSTTQSIDCAISGSFAANISFSTKPLERSKWSNNGTYSQLQIRGVSDLGQSGAIPLYLLSQGGRIGHITAGGSQAPLTGGAFKLQGQISTFDSASTLSGGNYKLQGEVLW